MEWNSNKGAGVLGLEWFPSVESSLVLDSFSKAACMAWKQTAGSSVSDVGVRVGAIPGRGGMYAVELYDNETAVPAGVQTIVSRPNEDYSGSIGATTASGWQGSATPTANLWSRIDELPGALDGTDYIITANYTKQGVPPIGYYTKLDTATIGLAGKRILGVRLTAVCAVDAAPTTMEVGLQVGGIDYPGWSGVVQPGTLGYMRGFWANNPNTKLPWTYADMGLFDVLATQSWAYVKTFAGTVHASTVYQMYAEIIVAAENRIAIGALNDGGGALTPSDVNYATLLTPTGTPFTKDGAGFHTMLVRRTSSVGSLVIPTLADPAGHPNPAEGFTPVMDATYGYASSMGDPTSVLFGAVLRNAGTALIDSQPYWDLTWGTVGQNGVTALTVQQEFSAPTAVTLGFVQALVRPNSATANLTIKVYRRGGGDPQQGQTLTLTRAAVDLLEDLGDGWKRIGLSMSAGFTGNPAWQYFAEFTSLEAMTSDQGDSWNVVVLDTFYGPVPGPAGLGDIAGFGGTTDQATVHAAEASRWDVPFTISTMPAAPAGLTAVVQTDEMPEWTAAACHDCAILEIKYLTVSWTATSLTTLFHHYELQRTDDGGTTWNTVAEVYTESHSSFDDYETPRGAQARYRIRVFRTDTAISVWSSTYVAPACAAISHELIFVSNERPDLNCAQNRDGSDDLETKFLEADDVVFHRIYGRDYQVAFSGTEFRGDQFSTGVIISADHTPTTTNEGVEMYQALRDLAHADIPYVCVMDHWGNRWFAQLQVPDGKQIEPGKVYLAQITVTQLQATPTTVVVV